MKKVLFSLVAMLLLSLGGIAQTTFTKITSASDLEAGANYLIVAHHDDFGTLAMGYQKSNNRNAVVVAESGDAITVTLGTDPSSATDVFQFTLGGSTGAWTFFDDVKGGYLYAASSTGNQLKTQTALDANGQWSITFNNDGTAEVVAQGENTRNNMRFNPNTTNGDPLFSCYSETSNIDTRVSFYKAGGAPVPPDPEPCDYPSYFEVSHVDGVDVTLDWYDAPCDVKYLVLASTGNITVPMDGTPVPNSDLAQNVDYGVQTVTFRGLQPNTTYHFAIFPYTNSGNAINYKTDVPYPTDEATTENISSILDEDFNEGLGVFSAYNAYGEQEWHQGSYQNTTYANMNGYANGASHKNEDWLISPVIVIPFDEYEELAFEFRTAKKYDGPNLEVLISMDYDGESEPSEATWDTITDAFDFSTGDYVWVESGQFVIYDPEAGHYHFAFLYTSTDEEASSWEIDYVKLTGKQYVSVNENSTQSISLYPNPAREQVSFMLDADAEVSIFDMTGRRVSVSECKAGQAQIGVSALENGVYFVNFRFANGATAVSKFVKF